MPLYEYRCKDCDKAFQVVESLPEHEKHRKVRCPSCSSDRVERVWSPVFVETAKKS